VSVQQAELATQLVPVPQRLKPAMHTLVEHEPFTHAKLAEPQPKPSGWLVSRQTGEPVAHIVFPPVLQALPDEQALASAHTTHAPALQTWPVVPHGVPLLSIIPLSWQADTPPVQVMVPCRHGAGAHAMPAAHAMQAPSLHTWPDPHPLLVPLGTFPLSIHWDAPVAQDVFATLHGVGVVQEVPSVHATQVPLLQTMLSPHELPFATFLVESTQLAIPALQESVPVWHLLVGVHAMPALQLTHIPALQTLPISHASPLGALPELAH
jgi:hypothetical protein